MALYTELPQYRDTYQLILKVYEITKEFSKEYKYTLDQDMKHDALQLMRSIYRANKHRNRAKHLEVFLNVLTTLQQRSSFWGIVIQPNHIKSEKRIQG